MKVNEIFSSIQGEGAYSGYPAMFIRLSGCNRKCSWCDTKYHTDGEEIKNSEISDIIKKSDKNIVVWTGGEPLLQLDDIKEVIKETSAKMHHLETNGDFNIELITFDYVSFSPKDMKAMKKVVRRTKKWPVVCYDIKVVTDLKMNKELIPYATMLMPLTTLVQNVNMSNYSRYDYQEQIDKENKKNEQKVWDYCVKNNIRFCPRIHTQIWGVSRGK